MPTACAAVSAKAEAAAKHEETGVAETNGGGNPRSEAARNERRARRVGEQPQVGIRSCVVERVHRESLAARTFKESDELRGLVPEAPPRQT
jgi:hypothetical protein